MLSLKLSDNAEDKTLKSIQSEYTEKLQHIGTLLLLALLKNTLTSLITTAQKAEPVCYKLC